MFTWSRLLTTLKRSRRMKVLKVLIVDNQFILIGLDNHYSLLMLNIPKFDQISRCAPVPPVCGRCAPWEVTEAMFMFPVCSPVSPQSPASASPGPGAEPQSYGGCEWGEREAHVIRGGRALSSYPHPFTLPTLPVTRATCVEDTCVEDTCDLISVSNGQQGRKGNSQNIML